MKIPLFPLELVLFPSETVPLHIYEYRYRAMVSWCMDNNSPFGIVYMNEDGAFPPIGCIARIVRELEKFPDGRSDILVEGQKRFVILQLYDNLPYIEADVKLLVGDESVSRGSRERLIAQHMRLLEITGRKIRPEDYQNPGLLSFNLSKHCGLSVSQLQKLLEIHDERDRLHYLSSHLEKFTPKLKQGIERQRKIQSNGHFADGNFGF